jgi:hypothetical protein
MLHMIHVIMCYLETPPFSTHTHTHTHSHHPLLWHDRYEEDREVQNSSFMIRHCRISSQF